MKYRRRRPLRIRWEQVWKLLLAVLLLAGLTRGCRSMNALVAVYGENRCRNLVTNLIAEAVVQAEAGEKLISFTDAEEKGGIRLESGEVRRIQTEVAAALTQRLDHLGEQNHRVRLGTVLDSFLLMDRGPEVSFRFVPVGSVQVSVDSELCAAGINQVLYRVLLRVETEMTILLPGGTRRLSFDQRIPVEEVLFHGEVPLVYGG